jgi:hypothetical protein
MQLLMPIRRAASRSDAPDRTTGDFANFDFGPHSGPVITSPAFQCRESLGTLVLMKSQSISAASHAVLNNL